MRGKREGYWVSQGIDNMLWCLMIYEHLFLPIGCFCEMAWWVKSSPQSVPACCCAGWWSKRQIIASLLEVGVNWSLIARESTFKWQVCEECYLLVFHVWHACFQPEGKLLWLECEGAFTGLLSAVFWPGVERFKFNETVLIFFLSSVAFPCDFEQVTSVKSLFVYLQNSSNTFSHQVSGSVLNICKHEFYGSALKYIRVRSACLADNENTGWFWRLAQVAWWTKAS